MKIKDQIIEELLTVLFNQLEKDISTDIDIMKYGRYSFNIEQCAKKYEININYLKPTNTYSDGFEKLILVKKPHFFNKTKRRYKKLLDKKVEYERKQREIRSNQVYISCLPEDRQKQIERELKLNRIVK